MFWDNLRTDIQFTLRQARRAPAFTLLAVLALALGIGANSAVYSVVNGVLLRPLPYDEPDRLVMIWSDNRNEGRRTNVLSPANFMDFRENNRTFAAMDYAVSFMMRLTVRGEEDAPPVWALRTGSDRQHRDDGTDAEHHPEHREGRPQLVLREVLQRGHQGVRDAHQRGSPGARAAPSPERWASVSASRRGYSSPIMRSYWARL